MLRYLKTVQKMKSIIVENNLTVMATTARYACAYTAIPAVEWWNKSLACVHFCPNPSIICPNLAKLRSNCRTSHTLLLVNFIYLCTKTYRSAGDLSRYFGGEVDLSSVMAHSLEWNEKAGEISKIPIDESKIPPEQRIPRVTSATW